LNQPANGSYVASRAELFGHPVGLYTLFFAEMWERFSYYGMRSLLVFYMLKGFLGFGDKEAYAVYGAYTALVYMTPFFGGLIADRLIGSRPAVVIGGALMAAGHLLMSVETPLAFYAALALLIIGNGFFKPNISTIVGSLYPPDGSRRDSGFTIFYMGINLGAAMSPLLCGYIGEKYGWHYGFGLATIGMSVGLAVFAMPSRLTQLMILAGAAASAYGLLGHRAPGPASLALNGFIAVAVLAAAAIACAALLRGGLPAEAGRLPGGVPHRRRILLLAATAAAFPLFILLVSGLAVVASNGKPIQLLRPETIVAASRGAGAAGPVVEIFLEEISRPAGLILTLTGAAAFGFLFKESWTLPREGRRKMWVALILIFFSMLFWAFFEQAGSSLNNFTDRNVDRVRESARVQPDQVGQTLRFQPTQEQLGFARGSQLFTLDVLDALRKEHEADPEFLIDWPIDGSNVGMGIAARGDETPASVFQAVNPTCILLFGLAFTALWSYLGARGIEPSTPTKFAMGLVQLGLGFGAFWLGARYADQRGMAAPGWLILGYVLHTTGELCLSPVGLSMLCRLSPARLISTMMGGWFLASAFSQYLAAILSQFTRVDGAEAGGATVPAPAETLPVYGGVFAQIAVMAIGSGVVCLMLVPLLKRWMADEDDDRPSSRG
jgi:POT family proton-dependent oligopeptide transporter